MRDTQLEPLMNHEERPHELALNLPAAHSAGRMGRQLVRQFAVREKLPDNEIETIEFVAGELLSNAVDHGGGNRAMDESEIEGDVRMSLTLTVSGMTWEMRVSDQGGAKPEDVQHLIDDSEMPDLEDERGRGFFLLIQMVDRLAVDPSEDGMGLAFVAVRTYG